MNLDPNSHNLCCRKLDLLVGPHLALLCATPLHAAQRPSQTPHPTCGRNGVFKIINFLFVSICNLNVMFNVAKMMEGTKVEHFQTNANMSAIWARFCMCQ